MTGSARAPVVRMGDPAGSYRRRLQTVTREPGVVVADMEDDFHRFRVVLEHDGRQVTAVSGEGRRTPWTTCGDAGAELAPLVGARLDVSPIAAAGHADPHANCTHMFDIAGLAFSHAAAGRDRRLYDVVVPPIIDGSSRPRLWRDGEQLLTWTLVWPPGGARGLVDCPPYSEAPWQGGFIRWAASSLDAETAEAAIVLRRACDIAMGRMIDLDAIPVASELIGGMSGVCYSMQPDRAPVAFRNYGAIRDFDRVPDSLLADVDARDP